MNRKIRQMMNKKLLLTLLVFISLSTTISTAYKLNVPKVLLPFHSSKLISFILEAKIENDSNEDLCFVWSSSRPDIVSIAPIYEGKTSKTGGSGENNRNECTSKAIVTAVSKHSQRLTSIILARETKSDKIVRCDVIVDQINSIRIKHTTTHLYLEDSPECFTVEALDAEGNTFSSLDGLAFEWSIINDVRHNSQTGQALDPEKSSVSSSGGSIDSRNVLRISKFIDSEYVITESIRQLESIGLSGHKILIEGLKTGTANVQSKLLDPFYKDGLKTPLVRLLVVANILLEPSYPIFVLLGAIIKYNVFLIKQTSVEKISLPSQQYYFESRNATVANLLDSDKTGSTMIGLALGGTEIVLVDRNMKEEYFMDSNGKVVIDQQLIVPPPTAQLHVVSPGYLVFSIKNWRSSWILEVGRTYEVLIQVYSANRDLVHPSDNLFVDSQFDVSKFHLDFQSRNGSYHVLTVLEKGMTKALAFLRGTLVNNHDLKPFSVIAKGEQDIELLDPIDVRPRVLIFALTPSGPSRLYASSIHHHGHPTASSSYEFQLQASGGSGSYYWQSRNTTIASVNSQGIVKTTATRIGQTAILVTDTRNIDIQSKSVVHVLEPVDLSIQACPVETQVGTKLYLNVQMNAYLNNADVSKSPWSADHLMPINDCSRLHFDVSIQDESVFRLVAIQSPQIMADIAKVFIKYSCSIIL